MSKNKQSFLQRLTGSMRVEEEENTRGAAAPAAPEWQDESGEAQLTVDVYQTPTEIIIQSIVAGVRPEDLDVNISREMVTIRGTRTKQHETREEDFYSRELYWGSFSRSVLLPQEIEVEKAEAGVKNGLLTIRLPKVNKERMQNLKIKIL